MKELTTPELEAKITEYQKQIAENNEVIRLQNVHTQDLEQRISEYQAELERRKAAKPRPVLPEGYTMTESFAIYYRGQLIFSNATVEEEEVQALIYKFHAQNHGADFIIPQYEGMLGIVKVSAGTVEEVAKNIRKAMIGDIELKWEELYPHTQEPYRKAACYALSLAPKQHKSPLVQGKLSEQEPPFNTSWVLFWVGKQDSIVMQWDGDNWSDGESREWPHSYVKENFTHFAYLRNENE